VKVPRSEVQPGRGGLKDGNGETTVILGLRLPPDLIKHVKGTASAGLQRDTHQHPTIGMDAELAALDFFREHSQHLN
jgi:hypothetical protein